MECSDNAFDLRTFLVGHEITLVEDEHVTELDLLGEQLRKRSGVVIARRERLPEDERPVELVGVNHGNGRVEVIQRRSPRGRDESPRNWDRVADSRGFDDEVIELLVESEPPELLIQFVLEPTADAPVRELRDAAVVHREVGTVLDEVGVDVHLADVVDEDSNIVLLTTDGEEVVEQGRLTGTEPAAQNRDWGLVVEAHQSSANASSRCSSDPNGSGYVPQSSSISASVRRQSFSRSTSDS